jgi:beta-lactamase class A
MTSSSAVLCCRAGLLSSAERIVTDRLSAIRSRIGGRLGIHALDTETGRRIGLDDVSHFAMASTFKLVLAAAVLSQVDRRVLDLEQRIEFGERDILSYAPVTSKNLAQGSLSVRELAAATNEAHAEIASVIAGELTVAAVGVR